MKSKTKQIENLKAGIYYVENVEESASIIKQNNDAPSGYYIEKSRKTEIFRLKLAEEQAQKSKTNWWTKIINIFRS